ncbi:MAG: FAD-dependent oxidoreductase, partial [Clostridiales bacterium]|nr:FAD-dependent oxidoreductase [Clostridiales bacterium]
MDTMNLTINGISVEAKAGETILQAARRAGVEIPTLCHDERVKTYGACGLCVVEAAGMPKLLRACSTAAADGMEITTDSERIRASRKTALEFLLSDHTGDCRPPCALACPAGTDCQGYVGLIANGEFKQALKVAKDVNPFPASIGRVCPHPCETACRRKHVEEPISIAWLKRFVADKDIGEEPYVPQQAKPTGKKVAVVGGGPGGLSSAYFLAVQGHQVTVYDAMPEMGGMLRYGIPAYRLPKDVVDREIDIVARLGVKLVNNRRLGQDFTLEELRRDNDAVVIATGAWVSRGMRVPGEELDCVVGGIDFLRTVALGKPMDLGKKVVVVGGGNTAMDACRTAVRLGAEEVSIIYRRTRAEMPADDVEIREAEEEGVVFRYLTNPLEFREGSVLLQKMELGEMDTSGRRTPVPIKGAGEELSCDPVI